MSLTELASDIAAVLPEVDATTTGQYGDGIGSEDEERQLDLLSYALKEYDSKYDAVNREVSYPTTAERCDIQLPDGMSVEAKLLRYWRANGDPEHHMPKQVFSPFHENTLLSDAERLLDSEFESPCGLLGLFYKRADDDPETVKALPERFTADDLAEKVRQDIEYWYECTVSVECVASVDNLQHRVHGQGAVITWKIL
jgi:hypothetical protein